MDIRKVLLNLFQNWIARLFGSFLAFWGIVEIIEWIGWKPLDQSPPLVKAYAFIATSLIIWLVSTLILHLKFQSFSKTLPTTISEYLESLLKRGQYESILRYRDSFSRAMLVEGKPAERLRLGEIFEEAALKANKKEMQAAALIDDIGWTLVINQDFDKAEKSILHGQKIATEINDSYWVAKSFRHLAGLYFEKGDFEKSKEHLLVARNHAQHISEPQAKNEILAGIEYGAALTALKNKDHEQAKAFLERSKNLRQQVGDKSRIVKLYTLEGKIAEFINDTQLAHDCYRTGLEEATKVGRTDEIIANHYGLSRTYAAKNDHEKSNEHREIADRMRKKTPIPFEN